MLKGFTSVRIGYRNTIAVLAVVWTWGGIAGAQAPDADLSQQAHSLRQIISTMEAEAAELEPRLAAARSRLSDLNRQIDEAAARLEAANADLAQGEAAEAELQAAIARATQERDRQEEDLKSGAAALADLEARAEAARASLADARQRLEAVEADRARSEGLAADIARQEAKSQDLAEAVRQLTAELTALARVRDAALAQSQPAAPAGDGAGDTAPAAAAGAASEPSSRLPPATDLQPRDPAQVDAALAAAPALPPGNAQQGRLRALLIEGWCVTDALGQTQNPINRQTLLALVGRLGGC